MIAFTVESFVSAPREQIYDFVADLASRPAFCGAWQGDYRLSHPRSAGKGAAARYFVPAPRWHHYVETQIVDADRPRRIVEATRGGHGGRARGEIVWELSRQGQGLTRIELTLRCEPGTARERVLEHLGSHRWLRRHCKRALERLRVIFEEGAAVPLARATVAGYEPLKGARFGESPAATSG